MTAPPTRGMMAQPPSHGQSTIQTPLPSGFRHRSEDSWIEVASQPSSSLSSAAEEIVTEGLRIQHDPTVLRRRRRRTTGSLQISLGRHNHGEAGSSQDEYEESESESDRAITSSSEGLRPSLLHPELRRHHSAASTTSIEVSEGDENGDKEDENSTAVNYPRSRSPYFTPQPNAFTHPPSSNRHHRVASASYNPSRSTPTRSTSQRHSYPSQQHTPYNIISPSYQVDHDAALRASLSTLLSLGAAARGLPKSNQAASRAPAPAAASTRVDPSTICMVPESIVLGSDFTSDQPKGSSVTSSEPTSPLIASTDNKQKRKVNVISQPRSNSKERQRTIKKAKRATSMKDISPTLLTWVLSAGVVVLFSAIGFSAGYVVGKENSRAEILGQLGDTAAKEAGRYGRQAAVEVGQSGIGLKKLRLSDMGAAVSSVRV